MPNDYPDWTHALIFFPQSGGPVSPADIPDWTTAAVVVGGGAKGLGIGTLAAVAGGAFVNVPLNPADVFFDDDGFAALLNGSGQFVPDAAHAGLYSLVIQLQPGIPQTGGTTAILISPSGSSPDMQTQRTQYGFGGVNDGSITASWQGRLAAGDVLSIKVASDGAPATANFNFGVAVLIHLGP